MTSRDESASYYDITLPDGHATEVWAILRAALTPEQALGYAKGCILARIMRDGRKDVDRQREAEKVGVEAGMLAEAMAACVDPRFRVCTENGPANVESVRRVSDTQIEITHSMPDPIVAALDAVDSHDPRECAPRVAELERERDEFRRLYESEAAAGRALSETHTRATADYIATTDEADAALTAEHEAHEATRRELERYRTGYQDVLRSEGAASSAMLGDLEQTRAKLAEYEERYRPRWQEYEKAPLEPVLLWCPIRKEWGSVVHGSAVERHEHWTHQPPAPEGE